MLFHSPEFILFAIVTLALYAAFPRMRLALLGVANALFYVVAGWPSLLLFLLMTGITHLCALRVQQTGSRAVVVFGVVANLLNLAVFKYAGFLGESVSQLLDLGLDASVLRLLLPVGISFYTFQLVAYLIDVGRGAIQPTRSFLELWVFISFFGHLVAGPIMRGDEFMPQVQGVPRIALAWDEIQYGLYRFAIGLVKKILLADVLATQADTLFDQWATLSGLEAWVAGWLFAFQIYYDFSAYSDMAVGIGHFFGLKLAENFRTPYLAANPGQFWERWHITLSQWIRDFVYIPLGGNRKGEWRAYVNLIIAMTLSGLWHGAAWTFVVWGLFHGVISAVHKAWARFVIKPLGWTKPSRSVRWISIFLMFQATTVGWIFFRAPSWEVATSLLGRMFTPQLWQWTPQLDRLWPFVLIPAALHVLEFWLREREATLVETWCNWVPAPFRAAVYTAMAAVLIVLARIGETSFIYFRF